MAVRRQRRTQEQRREEAAQRMLGAGARLVAERGLDSLTLADVGNAAGYSRGLPAHHFGSKGKFLKALVRFVAAEVTRAMDAYKRESGLPAVLTIIRSFFEHPIADFTRLCALQIVLSEQGRKPALSREIVALREEVLRAFEQQIRDGIGQRRIRPDVNPQMASLLLISAICGILQIWLKDREFDMEAAGSELVRMTRRSLGVSQVRGRSGDAS